MDHAHRVAAKTRHRFYGAVGSPLVVGLEH